MGEALAPDDISQDALLGGAVRLLQPRRGHRAGTDAVLLAALGRAEAGDLVVDLGSSSGAVGLMAAARQPGSRILLVEREPELVAMARRNIALNGLEARADVSQADVFAPLAERSAAGLPVAGADLVLTNPPFFEEGEGRASPEAGRRRAHAMAGGGLAGWIAACRDLLRPRGRLALIHRADRLADCLAALRGFGAIRVTPIRPRGDADATRILIAAVKDSRAPLALAPELVLHAADGGFTPEAAALHGAPQVGP
jgi:tRNA1(Val) A37 N6-methylase TrmN6